MTERYNSQRSRPDLGATGPIEYDSGMLTWAFVEQRMRTAVNYWIASAGGDGRPHAVPVWGAWLDDAFFFVGTGRKVRNLRANPHAVVHLESGDEVVIVEGRFEEIGLPSQEFLQRVDEEFVRKYGTYRPSEHLNGRITSSFAPEGLFAVHPQVVIAWSGMASDATRWRIESG
ncbi:MAG: pyridoxamine 5'-phosphate oxidase family protein [Caldilineaceae bacterium]|nr:pyridoxamine 5'-phosphate oxidase family protein [Caldilineaceae bacterium]MDE0340298.1 pyridoxamine 5'-phosphate oxidase family protein [Caldilineaceae bacterium]